MKSKTELHTGFHIDGRKEHSIVNNEPLVASDEVIRIHWIFFKKPYSKQRAVIRLLVWWAFKHYFKVLFKKDL
jgi:hypothetical protein